MTRHPLILIVALFAAVTPAAMAQNEPPNTRVLDCINGGCHTPIMSYELMHGPTAIAACDACHEYADPAQHTFVSKRQGSAQCSFCHVGSDTHVGKVIHEPFATGECISCHNPHGAKDKRFLKPGSLSEQCLECHTETVQGKHLHTSAANGDCLDCHLPHGGDHDHLLTASGDTLCLTCHEEVRERLEKAFLVHEPVTTGNCIDCHDAHASDMPNQLMMPPIDLCISCHEELALEAMDSTYQHSAVFENDACMHCHLPHAATHVSLLKDDPVATCLECHAEPIELSDDRTIASVSELSIDGMHAHGPLAEQRCSGCHQSHGAEHPKLLVANYTSNFYESFSLEHYALCFECHEQDLVLHESTGEHTGFRNGEKNLHYTHVNIDKNGHACRSCHSTHVSESPKQIAKTVPYGQWQLPLNFKPTATGGSCNSGCHRVATYDRVNATVGIQPLQPLDNGPTSENTAPDDPTEDSEPASSTNTPGSADQSSG